MAVDCSNEYSKHTFYVVCCGQLSLFFIMVSKLYKRIISTEHVAVWCTESPRSFKGLIMNVTSDTVRDQELSYGGMKEYGCVNSVTLV